MGLSGISPKTTFLSPNVLTEMAAAASVTSMAVNPQSPNIIIIFSLYAALIANI